MYLSRCYIHNVTSHNVLSEKINGVKHHVFLKLYLMILFSLFANGNRDLSQSERLKYGIMDNLVRFSFGVEDFEDLKTDVLQALDSI